MNALRGFLGIDSFMPHGHCYLWNTALILLHVASDALIAIAYASIPCTLIYFVRRRRDLPFHWMFLCFGAFILACGATHVMEIWTLWIPSYWLSGAVKAFTALVSVLTAVLLFRLVPQALALPGPEDLRAMNRELQKEIEQRAMAEESAQKLNAELREAIGELEAFSYSVSHDLRAPLRGIDGFSQALVEDYGGSLPSEAREHLGRVRASSQRMAQLIDDLLNLSRMSRVDLHRSDTDLSEIVGDVANQLRTAEPSREVTFAIESGVTASCDGRLVRVVLENLIRNAWKFTSKHARCHIEFGVERNGSEQPVYFVRDDGAGFDMHYVGKLFGPFQRLHGVSDFPGTGIGLATVQRIVRRHGGKVWAEGEVEKGATVHFTLGQNPGASWR